MKIHEIKRFRAAKSGVCNGKYLITATGRTVVVYDAQSLNELSSFKGMTDAYKIAIRPGHNAFAVKSNNGDLYFYDLDTMQLTKKLHVYSSHISQDEGCCYSRDGSAFYNIVYTKDLLSYLVRYDAETILETAVWFKKDRYVLYDMQYVEKAGQYVLQGYERLDNRNQDFLLWFDESAGTFTRIDLKFNTMRMLWMCYSPEQEALMSFSPLECGIILHEMDGTIRRTLSLRTEDTKTCTLRESLGEPLAASIGAEGDAANTVVVASEEILNTACFTEDGKHIIAAKTNGVWIFEAETMQMKYHIPISHVTEVITQGNRLYAFTWTGGFAYEVEWQ